MSEFNNTKTNLLLRCKTKIIHAPAPGQDRRWTLAEDGRQVPAQGPERRWILVEDGRQISEPVTYQKVTEMKQRHRVLWILSELGATVEQLRQAEKMLETHSGKTLGPTAEEVVKAVGLKFETQPLGKVWKKLDDLDAKRARGEAP